MQINFAKDFVNEQSMKTRNAMTKSMFCEMIEIEKEKK